MQAILPALDSIQRILNTRTGSLKHLPDHGLPDMTKILRSMPETAYQFISVLFQVLSKYEPRLKDTRVMIQEQEMPERSCYSIDTELRGLSIIRCGTDFTPEGWVPTCHLKRQGQLEAGVYRHGKESHQHRRRPVCFHGAWSITR